jgi:DNA excision repair protein ERCC-4
LVCRQLDPIWNTLASRTQQLVRDMRTLQDLMRYLLRFNPVSFLRYLQCLKTAAGTRTEWLLHSAANVLFQVRPFQNESFGFSQSHACECFLASVLFQVRSFQNGSFEFS